MMLKLRFLSSVASMAPDGVGSGYPGSSQSASTPASSPASSGAASPAPSPSPSPAPSPGQTVAPGVPTPPSEPGPGTLESQDFMSIFEPAPDVQIPGAEPVASPVAQPATPPAAAPSGAEPPAQPAPVQPTAQQPGAEGGGQPQAGVTPAPVSGQSPPLDPYDPTDLARGMMAHEAEITAHVAQNMFQLSKEDLEALETDVAGTIPKLLARGFVKTNLNTLMQLGRIIPEMVKRATEGMRNQAQNEDSFYQRWPQLNKETHKAIVDRYGVTYRLMNPNATKQQMIEDLGPLVLMAAKIPLTAPVAAAPGQSQGQQPALVPAGQRPPQPSPFVPAVPGPAANGQAQEQNPWEAMFAEQP